MKQHTAPRSFSTTWHEVSKRSLRRFRARCTRDLAPRHGNAQHAGIVLLPHAVEIALDDGIPVRRAQLRKHARQAGGQAVHRSRWVCLHRWQVVRQGIQRVVPAQVIRQGVAADLKQPGTGVGHVAEPAALAQGFDENVLQQVLRCHRVVQVPGQPALQLGFVRVPCGHQTGWRRGITHASHCYPLQQRRPQCHDGAAHKTGALPSVAPGRSITPQRPESLRPALLIK